MELNLNKLDNISDSGMERLKKTYAYVFLGILMATIGSGLLLVMGIKMSLITWIILIAFEFGALFWFIFKKNISTTLN